MNERIRQLAKEAGYYLYDLTETHECKTVETDSTDEWITLEKFAELIVKESVQMFAENGYDESCDMLIEHWDIDPRTFRS